MLTVAKLLYAYGKDFGDLVDAMGQVDSPEDQRRLDRIERALRALNEVLTERYAESTGTDGED